MEKNIREGVIQNENGKIPTDVWEMNNHTASLEYVNWHPTQKPLGLLERIIKAYTQAGETVLDIFSGSGSTAIASDNTSRIFKGCELSKEYWEKSIDRRINWEKSKHSMPGDTTSKADTNEWFTPG